MKFGRELKLTAEQINHPGKLLDTGEARHYVSDLLNVGRSTLYRALVTGHLPGERLIPMPSGGFVGQKLSKYS